MGRTIKINLTSFNSCYCSRSSKINSCKGD